MRLNSKWLAVPALLALGLSACSTSAAPGTANSSSSGGESSTASQTVSCDIPSDVTKGDGSKTVYLVSKGFQHRFWQAVKEGADAAGKDLGYKVEFVGPPSEQDVSIQIDQLETAFKTNPAAIGFAALDTKAAADTLKKISDAKIPLIAFDSGVDSDDPLTTVSTDNKAAAAEAAKHMVELTGGKGTVGLVCHDLTSATGKQRCEGFQEYIKSNAPEIKLLEPLTAGKVEEATGAAKSMIQSNADLVGIYGTNEAAATGAVQAANEVNKEGLQVVGFDSGKIQIQSIKEGKQAGAVTQSPVKMGCETVVAAVKAINGDSLPKTIDSGFAWYDKTNIDAEDIKPNLYE
ncbi:BMP family ABC transporter substrate-binding protein [Arachnia propionica]|uniref:BMP family ABC transporter substrate-binding protein n=1 Tax=Arachnia propionica TaxID=1750 RepID=A0A3P1T3C0_9ACTN|nr:ABC transporter substrate-binding protein [Arachnia propionica]MDO5082407.1 ABC transporter substrate-binding protein [Arachnia propionica]RRD04017.1 BMP family ABC transporter substrate-binding protein [Arachnia propionica]